MDNAPYAHRRPRVHNTNRRSQQNDADTSTNANAFSTGGGYNSVSLEDVFIGRTNEDAPPGAYRRSRTTEMSREVIRLDNPRPGALRARNEYISVATPGRNQQHQQQQNSSQAPSSSSSSFGQQQRRRRQETSIVSGRDGLQAGHRASSAPLTSNNAFALRSDHCNGYNARSAILPSLSAPASGGGVNFDRLKISAHSSRTAVHAPGRAVRVPSTASTSTRSNIMCNGTGMNGFNCAASSSSTVITSQPRNDNRNNNNQSSSSTCCGASTEDRRQNGHVSNQADCSSSSIMCKRCGRCRCVACTTPRPLPSRWIMNNSCLLSSESVVDAASCMCCVKGCLYHIRGDANEAYCESENGDAATADAGRLCGAGKLWSCSPVSADCCVRWTVLASAALCMPCIWCYAPFKACAKAYEAAYIRYHDNGCRCDRKPARDAQKRRRRARTLPPVLPSTMTISKTNTSGREQRETEDNCNKFFPHQKHLLVTSAGEI